MNTKISPSAPQQALDLLEEFESALSFNLDPFQRDAVAAIAEGRSVLVSAPTGTGKTVIAEFAVELALRRGLRAIYTTPIKALSNQKFRDFRSAYGEKVGLLTGDITENAGGSLLVMTTEVARNMLVQGPGTFQDVGSLVFDEVHYLADPERGTAWEESILLAPSYVPLVCLSATVANAAEVAEWLRTTGRDVALVESFERVVPLRTRYYLDGKLLPLLDGSKLPAPAGRQRIRLPGRARTAGADADGRGRGPRPCREAVEDEAPAPPDVVRSLDEAGLLPAIYFLFSRRTVEAAAEACQRMMLLSRAQSAEVRRLVKERLSSLSAEDRSLEQVEKLVYLLPRGIGFHHAGLLPPLKSLVEELLAAGNLDVVFATDTLALGINVPAKSVVVGEMTKFDGQLRRLLSPGEYRQLTGRAGRRGLDPVGYSVLLYSPWVPLDRMLEVAGGEVLPLESAFRPSYSTVVNLWQGPGEEERLAQLIAGSLRQFQEGGRIRELVEEREALDAALEGLPTTCPVCGDFSAWQAEEKRLKREEERAEAAREAAYREKRDLQADAAAWPWRYTKAQRRQWLRAAEPGAVAYSRDAGWVVYLGPSSEGIGSFFSLAGLVPLAAHSALDYLPDPPVSLELPDSMLRRSHLLDGVAAGIEPGELEWLERTLANLDPPDLEAEAAESGSRTMEKLAPAFQRLEERIAEAEAARHAAAFSLAANPYVSCPYRSQHRRTERERRSHSGLLEAVERDLAEARKAVARRAHRILRSLRSVLESLGYMSNGKPARKAAVLRRIFDSNGLIISELLESGALAEVSAVELAEVASWFASDKEGAGRALGVTERLARVRWIAEATEKQVLELERRYGVDLSKPLSRQFRGLALGWVTGISLGDLSKRSGLAEGDIVFALQKTIDLCRQIAQAAPFSLSPSVSKRATEAERLLRRGVVDSYYRWIVAEQQDGRASGT